MKVELKLIFDTGDDEPNLTEDQLLELRRHLANRLMGPSGKPLEFLKNIPKITLTFEHY